MGDVWSTLIGVAVGSGLSLLTIWVMRDADSRSLRKQQRAEWVQDLEDGGLFISLMAINSGPPDNVELSTILDRVKRPAYALNVSHDGDLRHAERNLRKKIGRHYSASKRYAMEGKPRPSQYFEDEDAIRDELEAWVAGKTKTKNLFVTP